MLNGKRVLFIAPKFFGYEKVIMQQLEKKGASVAFYSDRPGDDFLTKSLIRVDRRFLAIKTNKYYDNIIRESLKVKYDYILIVRGEAVSRRRLSMLRKAQPGAECILYLWDSMHYNPNAKNILHLFDKIFSFDRVDSDQNERINFLPLFFGEEFERSASSNFPADYDACFVGTVHTDRYKVLEKILDDFERKGLSIFVYAYYPSKTLYHIRSLFDAGFRRFGRKHLKFSGLTLKQVVDKIAESRAVIDINRPGQVGLTMRAIETVGAQRKLITTNVDISNYDIFSEEGVLVLDRNNPEVSREFLLESCKPFAEVVRERYSVSSWVNSIFS